MNVNSIDDPSLTELLSNNRQLLEHVKEQKIFPGKRRILWRTNSSDKQLPSL